MIGRRRGGMYGRRRAEGIGIFLLALQVMRVGLDNIPPVTLATLAANTAIFLRILKVPGIRSVCISAREVWYRSDWSRLLLAPWFHASDMHLYFNMVSLLWKGISLERRLGSKYFAYMIAVFTVLSSSLLVGLNILAAEVLDDHSYISSCAVGFSAVLFAIKMVTTHFLPPGTQWIMGLIPVHSRIACWVELVVIQLLVPHASFTGHLAGILVGLAYVKGPLKSIMDMFLRPEGTVVPQQRGGGRLNWASRFFGGGTTGRRQRPQQRPVYPQYNGNVDTGGGMPQPDYDNRSQYDEHMYTGGMTEEEQLQQALNNSVYPGPRVTPRPSTPPAYNQLYPDLAREGNTQPDASPPVHHNVPPPPSAPPLEPEDTNENEGPPAYGFVEPNTDREPPNYGFVDQHEQTVRPRSGVLDQDELRRRRLARFDR
ncbi:rhomboid-related protein 4-like [Glandiceps talaboti]